MRIHLIANAHLDPVWLWDWREGLNEGITTCRTVLDLMDEYPELTFVRGETSIYEHIQRHDPATFARIQRQIAAGRWDVVGGTYVQPDTNLPATEVCARHLQCGLGYAWRELGVRPRVAWCADSFGHSAGWPEIYAAAGMKAFAFSRPMAADLPLPGPAFWWEAASGARILSWRIPLGWYGSKRDEVTGRLDATLAAAPGWGLRNIAVFLGLGNHGGGPSRRQIDDILRWKDRHPEVTVEFSTLHRFFGALERESAKLPVVRGELNFTLRGCYSSAAAFKFAYRRTENRLLVAERTGAAVGLLTGAAASDLGEAWRSVLFNTFHDILPGSSIERAYVDQQAWLGVAYHHAQRAELDALNALAASIDTTVPPAPGPDRPSASPVLVWNPHPYAFDGQVEIEAPLDYRPLDAFLHRPGAVPLEVRDAQGRALPFQETATENNFAPEMPWRKRLIVPLRLPASGWQVVTVGWVDRPLTARRPRTDVRTGAGWVANRAWRVGASAGADHLVLRRLDGGKTARTDVLKILTVDDPWGSWGGHDGEKEAEHIHTVTAQWRVKEVRVLETGPERAALWVSCTAGASRLDLTLCVGRDDPALIVRGRLFWAERGARLKLEFPFGGEAEFEVPGARITRKPCGEVPGGRWVRVGRGRQAVTLASDAFYNFDAAENALRATVVRSCRHAWNARAEAGEQPWRPFMDLGEHVFQFGLAGGEIDPDRLADRIETPPLTLLVPVREGPGARAGSVLEVLGACRLLSLQPTGDAAGWIVRLQSTVERSQRVALRLLGRRVALGVLRPHRIATYHLQLTQRGWSVRPVTIATEKLSGGGKTGVGGRE